MRQLLLLRRSSTSFAASACIRRHGSGGSHQMQTFRTWDTSVSLPSSRHLTNSTVILAPEKHERPRRPSDLSIPSSPPPVKPSPVRYYSCSTARLADGATQPATSSKPRPKLSKEEEKKIFDDIVVKKREYREKLRSLRKSYASEIAQQRKIDEAADLAERAAVTRAKRERQRLKNLRSVANERAARERREEARALREKRIIANQKKREVRARRFHKARQILLAELEEESHLWMTTAEEVESNLSGHANMQKLWVRPHSLIGVMPEDAVFWRYTCDTWDMSKTYQTPRERFLEQIEEELYLNANVDYDNYWTNERTARRLDKEERARLRAAVRSEALRKLVKKHIEEETLNAPAPETAHLLGRRTAVVPHNHPLREQRILDANDGELEEMEAAVALNRRNLRKFFNIDEETGEAIVKQHEGWPVIIGRQPRESSAKKLSEKERKKQQKEDEAAWAKMDTGVDDDEFQLLDEEGSEGAGAAKSTADGERSKEGGGAMHDSDDDEEEEDDESDPLMQELRAGPEEDKVREEDVDWIIEQLEKKLTFLQESDRSEESAEQEQRRSGSSANVVDADEETTSRALEIIDSLTDEQQQAIGEIDLEVQGEEDVPTMLEALGKIEGLSEEKIQAIVDLELSHCSKSKK